MSKMMYASEKFVNAVYALATSESDLQDRLYSAYLSFHPVQIDDFDDDELRADYQKLKDLLTQHLAIANEGRVRATLSKLTVGELQNIAELIVHISYRLEALSR